MTALIHTGVARIAVRANWGRWILDCSRCTSATWVQPGADLICCFDCRTPAEAVWPTEELRYGIERLLLMRPDVTTRNWQPEETLHDLLEENMHHGLLTPLPSIGAGPVFGILDETITVDHLPAIGPQELKAVTA